MFCYNCGNSLAENAKFCPNCGAKVHRAEDTSVAAADKMEKEHSAEENASAAVASGENGSQDHRTPTGRPSEPNECRDDDPKGEHSKEPGIKPYYREEFERIASGQKHKFNWAALFLNGWIQLYNGCTKIFCKTFLPLLIALFVVSVTATVGALKFHLILMAVSSVLMIVIGISAAILSIMNGMKFNKWYYQDVIDNPGKKRSRKGFWILLICEMLGIVVSSVLLPRILSKSFQDDYAGDWSDDELYGESFDYGDDDAIDDKTFEAGDNAIGGETPEIATVAVDEATAETALQILLDWFQRRPLMHNVKVEFMEQAVEAGDGTSFLLYGMYLEQKEYGVFGINPSTGDIVMDSIVDDGGNIATIQAEMDQWYLECYWGWTEDSGCYMEAYTEDIYELYNGEGALILEYYSSHDEFAICDYDGQHYIEYDDGSAISEVSLSDFAGSYWCDLSGEVEGTYVENGYGLEIGEWDGYCFSIAEEWRGMDQLRDDYARLQCLIRNTLTFVIYNPDSGVDETHSLTYVPAAYSPLGRDVVYLDGDETMPFEKQ